MNILVSDHGINKLTKQKNSFSALHLDINDQIYVNCKIRKQMSTKTINSCQNKHINTLRSIN